MTGDRSDHEAMVRLLPRYEFGSLSDDERRAFETHVLECDLCFGELERGSVAVGVMRDHAPALARALGREPSRAAEGPPSRAGRVRALVEGLLRPRALVPALAILLIAVIGVRVATRPDDFTRLATFPREELASAIVRGPGVGDAVRELMEAGAGYFDTGRYDEAARRFRAALERDPQLAEAAYLLGLSEALAGAVKESIPSLEDATRIARGDLRIKAQWVLANAYIKEGRLGEARSVLEALASEEGEYALKARALLAHLPL